MTYQEALAELLNPANASKYSTLESLMGLIRQVSIAVPNEHPGAVTLLYSGTLTGEIGAGDVATLLAETGDGSVRIIDRTDVGRLLMNRDVFGSALQRAAVTQEAANAWLFDARNGAWADTSGRFVAAATGDIVSLTPFAPADRIFAQTEIPAALANPNISSINGVPKEVLVNIRDAAVAIDGPNAGLTAVRNALAFVSVEQMADMRVVVDANGVITALDTGRLFDRTTYSGMHLIGEVLDASVSVAAESAELVRTNQQNLLSGAQALDNGIRITSIVEVAGRRLNALGNIAALVSYVVAVHDAAEAAEAGDSDRASRIMFDWTVRTEGGLLAGYVVGSFVGAQLAPLLAAGPAGPVAWLVATLGAGAVAGYVGSEAAASLFGISTEPGTRSDTPNSDDPRFLDRVTTYSNGVRLQEYSAGGTGENGVFQVLIGPWERRWDIPTAGGGTAVIYQDLVLGRSRQEIWTGLPGQSTLIARTDIAPAEDGGASIKNYAGTVLVTERVVTSNEFGGTTTRTYDANRVLHNTVIRTPSAGSVEIVQTDPSDASRVTTTRRDAGERIVEVTEQECLPNGLLVTRSYDPSSGQLTSTTVTQRFDDGSRIEEVSYPDGSSLRSTYDDANQLVSRTGTAGPLQSFGTAIQDINALVGAIRSGQPLPILSSGLRLIDNQVNPVINNTQATNNQPLFQTTAVVSAINSLYSLDRAFSGQGNDLDRVSATANAVYSVGAAAQATGLISRTGAVAGVSNGVGAALPYLNAVIAIKNGDYVGAAVSIVAISFPVVGWIYAAYTLITALGDEPPEAWATGRIRFAGAGNVGGEHDLYYDAASGHVLSARDPAAAGRPTALEADIVGDAFGPQRVSSLLQGNGQAPGSPGYFGGLLGYLDGVIAQAEQASPGVRLGIVPQRLPSISWQEARRSDPGYSIVDVDPLTGEQRHPQLRYNDDFSPYNADPTDLAQRRDLFQRMIDSALERNAIASEWEVRTALLQQDAGDPNAGRTRRGRSANDFSFAGSKVTPLLSTDSSRLAA